MGYLFFYKGVYMFFSKYKRLFLQGQDLLNSVQKLEKGQRQLFEMMNYLIARNEALFEAYWANVYRDTIIDSKWLKNKTVSAGRWAVSYYLLYVLYRILNEVKPKNILECGLGQSSRLMVQYAEANNADLIICENSEKWIEFFKKQYPVARNYVHVLDTYMTNVVPQFLSRTYLGFNKLIGDKKFNLVLIDGPEGSEHFSRPNILDLVDNLDSSFVVLLDDMNRIGECETWDMFKKKLDERGVIYREQIFASEKRFGMICSPDLEYLLTL